MECEKRASVIAGALFRMKKPLKMRLARMSYTIHLMKRTSAILVFLCTAFLPLFAAQQVYQDGKVADIQQKVNTRILYYQVNTPITQDDPYYEVSVQVGSVVYLGQYTPRHPSDTLPEDLTVTSAVQVRLDKRHMFIKRPSGGELDLIVIKHGPAKSEQDTKADRTN